MAAVDTIAMDVTSLVLIPFLKYPEVLSLESVCKSMVTSIQKSTKWFAVACSEIPEVSMDSVLKDVPNRQALKRFIARMRGISFVNQHPIPFHEQPMSFKSWKQAQDFVKIHNRAADMAALHQARGGHAQMVFVGRFHFPSLNRSTTCHQGTQSGTHVSEAVKTKLPWQLPATHQKQLLYLKLILHKGKMHVSAKLQGHRGMSKAPNFLIDLDAVGDSTILQMRNLSLPADGSSMKSGCGIYCPQANLPTSLTCVVFVRDEQSGPAKDRCLANTLCLDVTR